MHEIFAHFAQFKAICYVSTKSEMMISTKKPLDLHVGYRLVPRKKTCIKKKIEFLFKTELKKVYLFHIDKGHLNILSRQSLQSYVHNLFNSTANHSSVTN